VEGALHVDGHGAARAGDRIDATDREEWRAAGGTRGRGSDEQQESEQWEDGAHGDGQASSQSACRERPLTRGVGVRRSMGGWTQPFLTAGSMDAAISHSWVNESHAASLAEPVLVYAIAQRVPGDREEPRCPRLVAASPLERRH